MSIPHSAPLYLLYSVSTLPKRHRHGEPGNGNGCFEFEFAAGAEDDDDDSSSSSSSSAAPRACSSDVGAAFADQLFRGGVLLPLKLPPRLHPSTSAASSAATSPTAQQMGCRAPSSVSWSPFASVGRKERGAGAGNGGGFDPFAAALEKVRRDGAGLTPTPRRRARSLSPAPLRGGAGLISSARPAAASAQKGPPWQRWKRGGVKHFLSTAPRALRPRCRKDDGGVSSYRPGHLVCFGL